MTTSIRKWEDMADAVLGVAASILLFCMMVLTFFDVLGRYVFNRPIRGAFELTELGLLVLIFAGLPLVSHADEHVTMDFIDKLLGDLLLDGLNRLVNLACAGVMFFLTWQIWIKAGRIMTAGDYTDTIQVPYGPFVYFMAAMVALTGLVHLYRVFVPSVRKSPQATT